MSMQVGASQGSFHPDLLVSVSTLVRVYKLSLLPLKVEMTHFRKTEAKQSKNKHKRKEVLFSYALQVFIIELYSFLFFYYFFMKIIRSRRKHPWRNRSLG